MSPTAGAAQGVEGGEADPVTSRLVRITDGSDSRSFAIVCVHKQECQIAHYDEGKVCTFGNTVKSCHVVPW